MPDYKISEVTDRSALRKFVKFPDRLYKNCPQYVPALHSDQYKSLTKSPSLAYCKHKLWIVTDGKKAVGRICAIINPRYNELYNKKRVRFGWFDCIEDLEVARLLLSTAEDWARAQGMTEIHGPLYYNTLGKQGMLVEGYENIPPFNCLYNYSYYNDFMTSLGFVKECDWLQYKMPVDKGVPEKTTRVAKLLLDRYKLHFADIDKLKKDPEQVHKFFKMYNDSFSGVVYNFVPFTEEEIAEESKSLITFVSNKVSCMIMDENDNLVAFGISFPSLSKALQKAKGRLFPFGWIHLIKALNNYEVTDLMVNGAVPEWQNRGISAVYYCEMAVKSKNAGSRWAIANPQIETNSAVNIWHSYEREPFMRRRCYIKPIAAR